MVQRVVEQMLWLQVHLASHPLSDDSLTPPLAKASTLSARQRSNLRAATARDAATKPPRDSASPGATMKRRPEYLQSEALVSEAVSAGRALSEVCGACTTGIQLNTGAITCCDAAWASYGAPYTCAFISSNDKMLCSGCNCPGDPSPPPLPPALAALAARSPRRPRRRRLPRGL